MLKNSFSTTGRVRGRGGEWGPFFRSVFNHQRRIATGAQGIGGGTIPPMKSPAELLTYGTVDSDNIANQFQKKTDV